MSYDSDIQWFPGHMTKTRRMIEADIKLVDAVAEIVDSRIPFSSRNPFLSELIGAKPRIIIMNKCDYADDNMTAKWRDYFRSQGCAVLVCDCRSGKGVKNFVPLLKSVLSEQLERRRQKGVIGGALRVMTAGIPNVGKSSFINRMANSKKTAVGDRPGITKGKQWVKIDKEAELLDTPGILAPKFEDKEIALKLAYTGAIKDEILDTESLAESLAHYIVENYPNCLERRYNIEDTSGEIIKEVAKARGMMISGGEPDTLRAASAILDEYRSGKIGKITLEAPPL